MLKFFSKCYETICCILIVLNFILFGVLGSFTGGYCADFFGVPDCATLFKWLFGVGGVAVAFFFNVFVFGFVAQVIEIKKLLETTK